MYRFLPCRGCCVHLQSLTASRGFFVKRDPDAEIKERRRRVPVHTFINVELLEACQVRLLSPTMRGLSFRF